VKRERDFRGRDDRWDPAVGEREREGELGWVGSGRSGPAGLPGAAQLGSWPLLLFIFFLLLSFSFILISVLSFERALLFRFKQNQS
jgi:hypothetical protein